MEITLIWFPLMKAIFTAILIYGAYYFFKTGRRTIGFWYTGMIVVFWIFMPIKYDGTNSVIQGELNRDARTQQYKEVAIDKTVTHTKKPTFAERMKAEDERSAVANTKVLDEIVK